MLLTKPVKATPDKRLSTLAFPLIDLLKHEKSILITKALSWLLRSLLKFHREEVVRYIDSNKDLLPRIAIRETLNKMKTGRKSGI